MEKLKGMIKHPLVILFIALFCWNIFLAVKNQDCPFHVDYVQYIKSINNFYDSHVLDDNVNGKYLYVYLMAILATPFKLLGLNIYGGLIFINGLFQLLALYLFFVYTKSTTKTYLMATTQTFITLFGNMETVMLSSVFLLLFFIYRDKPYSEFFIMIASFIRLDSAIYYLFAKKKTVFIPFVITGLQWLSGKLYFIKSDFGISQTPLNSLLIFIVSFGICSVLFLLARPKERSLDPLIHALIVIFIIFGLKFASQKVFFFPVMLAFMFYDFRWEKITPSIIVAIIFFSLLMGVYVSTQRANHCTASILYDYSKEHPNTFFGIFQPYLDYYGEHRQEPFNNTLTFNCRGNNDYILIEDHRNANLLFLTKKVCSIPYKQNNHN